MDTDQLNLLHDYARTIGRIKDDLETAAYDIGILAINLDQDIAAAKDAMLNELAQQKQEALEEADERKPRHCRTCGAELTTADTGFTTCNACAWAARKAKRKEGTTQ
jgi:ABC-type thiamine transport system substrate-binding protein